MDRNEALAALGTMDAAKADLARAADCPPWRHVAFGLVMGVLVLAQGLASPLSMGLLACAMAGVVLLVRADRKRMGVFVNGYRKGRTRVVAFVMLGVMMVLVFAEIHARESGLSLATRLGIGALAVMLGIWGSLIWQRVFRKDLGL
ncbi:MULTISPECIES: hypothetical protein [Sphingomonas]|uniref:hypothetical protein n=1 Tax=Sphingomonas TaxID=13687 RepID=UPI000DEF9A73|nr:MULTISPECIES: hypothetical protein [Sphingomonas]